MTIAMTKQTKTTSLGWWFLNTLCCDIILRIKLYIYENYC